MLSGVAALLLLSKTVEFQKGVTVGKNLEETTEPKRQTKDDLTS